MRTVGRGTLKGGSRAIIAVSVGWCMRCDRRRLEFVGDGVLAEVLELRSVVADEDEHGARMLAAILLAMLQPDHANLLALSHHHHQAMHPHTRALPCPPYWAAQYVPMDLPPYQYQTLPTEDTIRIVVLEPADDYEAPLNCSILIKSRRELFQSTDNFINNYEAVSYAWGVPTFTKTLICNGTSLLNITSHVDDMLRSLRKTHRSRNLWIDAISLDQADLQEKSQQVPLMGNIYHQASKGIIWLRLETPGTKEVFAFLRVLATVRSSDSRSVDDIAAAIFSAAQKMDVFLKSFLGRPWFQRRWILQEAAKARSVTVRCGQERITWRWLVDAFAVLSHEVGVRAWRALDTVRTIQNPGYFMLDLLWEVDHAQCSDPRDRLFALYGLAESISMRYALQAASYDVPWQIIYARFAASCISNGQFVELVRHLTAFGSLCNSDRTMPSWVPDWRRTRSGPLPAWMSSPHSLQSQSTSRDHFPIVSYDGNKLSLSGGFENSLPITHLYHSAELGLWSVDEWKNWPRAVDPEDWGSAYDPSKEPELWSWNQRHIFEVVCRAISILSLPNELSVANRRAIQLSLRYFSDDQTVSAESTALKMSQLAPYIRSFLCQYALFSWTNLSTIPMFGIGPASVVTGDMMVSRSPPDRQAFIDEGNAIGWIVHPNDGPLWPHIRGRVVGVAVLSKRTLTGVFSRGLMELT